MSAIEARMIAKRALGSLPVQRPDLFDWFLSTQHGEYAPSQRIRGKQGYHLNVGSYLNSFDWKQRIKLKPDEMGVSIEGDPSIYRFSVRELWDEVARGVEQLSLF